MLEAFDSISMNLDIVDIYVILILFGVNRFGKIVISKSLIPLIKIKHL